MLSDYWKASRNPGRAMSRPWEGTTEFHAGPTAEESGAPNSAARWLTPRGPGIPETHDRMKWADDPTSEEDEA